MNNQEIQQELKNLENRMAELRGKLEGKQVMVPLVENGQPVAVGAKDDIGISTKMLTTKSKVHLKAGEYIFVSQYSNHKIVVEETEAGNQVAYITKK